MSNTTTSERQAREKALEILADFERHDAAEVYAALYAIEGIGTTRLLSALRNLEAEDLIVVERRDGRAKAFRLATPTAEELDGPIRLEVDRDRLADALDKVGHPAADEIREMPSENLQRVEELSSQDAAVAYFASTVRTRLEGKIVEPLTYILEAGRSLDDDATKVQEYGYAGELESDQVVEKLARIQRKREVLSCLADEFSAAAPELTTLGPGGERRLTLEGASKLLDTPLAGEPIDHGTVKTELAEYRESGVRVVVCELTDGWHVAEVYRPGEKTHREVVEEYGAALEYARGQLPERDPLNPCAIAADALVSALGRDAAMLLLVAMRAGWLTPAEAAKLEPQARELAIMLETELPPHRDAPGLTPHASALEDRIIERAAELIGEGMPQGKAHREARRELTARPGNGLRDATAAELFEEPDAVIEAIVAGEIQATPQTVALAKAELENRSTVVREPADEMSGNGR